MPPPPLWIACLPSQPAPARLEPPAALLAAHAPAVAALEDAWVADVSTTLRLMGGRAALLRRLWPALRAAGWTRVGVAPTALAALAVARTTPADGGWRALAPHTWTDELDTLPVALLGAAQPHLTTLHALGLRTLGALRQQEAAALAARTSPDLVQALRQCYALAPTALPLWQPPPVFEATLELPAPTADATALTFAAQRLLHQLQAWLQRQRLGVLRWALGWPPHALDALVLQHPTPVQDIVRLQRLLHERLARLPLAQPVQQLSLRTLQVTTHHAPHDDWLRSAPTTGAAGWDEVLERLQARLGPARVHGLALRATWTPHARQQPRAPDASAAPTPPLPPDSAWLPPWWLPAPQPLACDGSGRPLHRCQPLRCLLGPLRLRAPSGATQLGYIATDGCSRVLWITRDDADGARRWRLRGVYA